MRNAKKKTRGDICILFTLDIWRNKKNAIVWGSKFYSMHALFSRTHLNWQLNRVKMYRQPAYGCMAKHQRVAVAICSRYGTHIAHARDKAATPCTQPVWKPTGLRSTNERKKRTEQRQQQKQTTNYYHIYPFVSFIQSTCTARASHQSQIYTIVLIYCISHRFVKHITRIAHNGWNGSREYFILTFYINSSIPINICILCMWHWTMYIRHGTAVTTPHNYNHRSLHTLALIQTLRFLIPFSSFCRPFLKWAGCCCASVCAWIM